LSAGSGRCNPTMKRHDPSTSGKSIRFGHPLDKKFHGTPMEDISADSFRIGRNPPRINAKCGDHFLQADFPVIFPTGLMSRRDDHC